MSMLVVTSIIKRLILGLVVCSLAATVPFRAFAAAPGATPISCYGQSNQGKIITCSSPSPSPSPTYCYYKDAQGAINGCTSPSPTVSPSPSPSPSISPSPSPTASPSPTPTQTTSNPSPSPTSSGGGCLIPYFVFPETPQTYFFFFNGAANESAEFELVNNCDKPVTLPSAAPFTIRLPGFGKSDNNYSWGIAYQPSETGPAPVIPVGGKYAWSWDGMANHILYAPNGNLQESQVQNPPIYLFGPRTPKSAYPTDQTIDEFAVDYSNALQPLIAPDPLDRTLNTTDGIESAASQPCFLPGMRGPQDPNGEYDGNGNGASLISSLLYCVDVDKDPTLNQGPKPNLEGIQLHVDMDSGNAANDTLGSGPLPFGAEITTLSLNGLTLTNESNASMIGNYDVSYQLGLPGSEREVDVEQYDLDIGPGDTFTVPEIDFDGANDPRDGMSLIDDAAQDAANQGSNILNLSVVVRQEQGNTASEARIPLFIFPTVVPTNVTAPSVTYYTYNTSGDSGTNNKESNETIRSTTNNPIIPDSTNPSARGDSSDSTVQVSAGAGNNPTLFASNMSVDTTTNTATQVALTPGAGIALPVQVVLNPFCTGQVANGDCDENINATKGTVTLSSQQSAVVANGSAVFSNVNATATYHLKSVSVPYTTNDVNLANANPIPTQTVTFDNPIGVSDGTIVNPQSVSFIFGASYTLLLGLQQNCLSQPYQEDGATKYIPVCLEDDTQNGILYGTTVDISKDPTYKLVMPEIMKIVNKLAQMPAPARPPFAHMTIRIDFNDPDKDQALASFVNFGTPNLPSFMNLGSRVAISYMNSTANNKIGFENIIIHELMHSVDYALGQFTGGTKKQFLDATDFYPQYNQSISAQVPTPNFVKIPQNLKIQDQDNQAIMQAALKNTGSELWDLVSYHGPYQSPSDGAGYPTEQLLEKEKYSVFAPTTQKRQGAIASLNHETFAEEAATMCTYSVPANAAQGAVFPILDTNGVLSLNSGTISSWFQHTYGSVPKNLPSAIASVNSRLNTTPFNQVYTWCTQTYPTLK